MCIWTVSNNDCMILRSIFSHRGQLRDSCTTITEDSNTHWCSRRKNHALRAGAWTLFECEDQGKFNLICLLGNIFCCFWRAVLNEKIWYLGKTKKYTNLEPSVIVLYESLSCPRCEKMDLKIIQSLLETVQIHTNAGKPKNLWELKDFSEEQQEV